MLEREAKLYVQRNPKSKALSAEASRHWLRGVPMHWMVDWGLPFPLFVEEARGVTLKDADGHSYVDFCLGDTGAMFGHAPDAVTRCLAREAARGLTTMLPSPDAVEVGKLLEDRFGLPFWQVTATASDANRAVLRWARAITGRSKILVFNHCYHGCVDDTFVTADGGKVKMVEGLVGEPRDLTAFTKVVEFNDVPALEAALRAGDVACVLAEPVMTNVGMVLPAPGFLESLRALTSETGTILVFDETHTLTSSVGGYARSVNIRPDGLVFGKPIAGGIPAALYGFSADVADRIQAYLASRGEGRSGIGTTLSGSRIQMALIRTVLEEFMTDPVYEANITLAKRLERGIADVIIKPGLPWHVTRVGARVEFMCVPKPPRNGFEASQAIHKPIDEAVHRYLLNRGVVVTPFHNMMLVCPSTTESHVNQFIEIFEACVTELQN
ncbi:MAG: aspartate aminotransferase family protein [Alphaproteobacteria bacterium]|nr:aspartate aminotransferase family protein [Alphaproteobacteria bacterium]